MRSPSFCHSWFRRDVLSRPSYATGNSPIAAFEVLLGNGDGTFRLPVAYDAGAGTLVVAAADVNGDGKLDLLVTNSGNTALPTNGGGMVAVLLGNGDGAFQPKIEYPTGRFANFVLLRTLTGTVRRTLKPLERTASPYR